MEEGKETIEDKVEYYDENREEVVGGFLSKFQSPKEPAVAGTIVVVPVLVTLLVIDFLFDKLAAVPGNQYFDLASNFGITGPEAFYFNQTFKLGIMLVLGAFLVTGIGRFVKTRTGFMMERGMDAVIARIPLLGSVYNITKVTVDTVLTGPEGFKKPAKIRIGDLRVTGFKTGNRTEDGRNIVFVPTSPNITSGFVVEVEDEMMIDTDESAEDALTRVLSAGFGDSDKDSKSGRSDAGKAKVMVSNRMEEPGYREEVEEFLGGEASFYRLKNGSKGLKNLRKQLKPSELVLNGLGTKEVYSVSVSGKEAAIVPLDSSSVLAVSGDLELEGGLELYY